MTAVPTTEEALKQNDVVPFLQSTTEGFIPIYISSEQLFLYSIAVPSGSLPESFTELPHYSVDVSPSYSYWQSGGEIPTPHDFALSPPGEGNKPEFLAKGTPLTALKYYRHNDNGRYIQLPQDLTDVAQLHYDEETGDFCRIDRNGDEEAVCHVFINTSKTVVAIKSQVLYAYLLLKDSVLVRLFDTTRKQGEHFLMSNLREDVSLPEHEIYADFIGDRATPSDITMMRGAQIIGTDRDYIWSQAKSELTYADEVKEYCNFIIIDWKNERTTTCSCAPEAMSSYFEPPNNKPFETSPAFFRPEVLDKYKNNPDLYELRDRQVYKIDGWSLRTYDVNEEGQVHTYLRYLADLPYEEQFYWKSFNEKPKGSTSKRAYETDFEGKWSELTNPAEVLKHLLENVKAELPLLFPRLTTQDVTRLHQVLTDNRKQWGDALLQLDQLIVESLDKGQVQELARAHNCLDKQLEGVLE